MPVSGPALAALIQSNMASRMTAIAGINPLSQSNPSYFIQMCQAIGNGIITGGPSITFTTSDTGFTGTPPVPGVGTGMGIITDPIFFVENLYNNIRGLSISQFGGSNNVVYPPTEPANGQYLEALCQGINDAFLAYYPTAWTLSSTHPLVYAGTGTIADGGFSGLVAATIQSTIVGLAPSLQGSFWPSLAQAISESYVTLIEQHSTGQVTIVGVCVPSPSQVCAIPGVGAGSGAAT